MNCREIGESAPLYLSGEMEEGQGDLFRTHLAECRDCAGWVTQQAAMDARLRHAFSSELPDGAAIEERVRGRISKERSRRWTIVAASVAAAFVAAVLGNRMLRTERIFSDAAEDHQTEVVEHQPRHWRTSPAEVGKLTARYGLSNVAAIAPEGYRLEHAKMCDLDDGAALHLVYTNGAREFSVFVRPRKGVSLSMRTATVGSEHLAAVRTDRLEAVIVTDGSSDECLQLARVAAGVL